jgi:hypothetical protein
MISKTVIRAVALLGVAWSIGPACASTSQGTDSNTHWIECNTVADCPNATTFACVGGHCVDANGDSGTPSTGGRAGSGGAAGASGAGRPATGGMAGSSGVAQDSGGAGRSATGGAIGSLDGGRADAGRCDPMDARPGPLDCSLIVGFTWTGSACAPIYCSCMGADCVSRYETEAECRNARVGCTMAISTECERNSDCVLVNRQCCACGELTLSDVAAINVASQSDFYAPCRELPPCPPCVPAPAPFPAECVAGRCTATNLLQHRQCLRSEDCEVRPVDCCACGSLTSRNEVTAINSSSAQFPACSGVSCAPCSGLTLPPDLGASCYQTGGFCVLTP